MIKNEIIINYVEIIERIIEKCRRMPKPAFAKIDISLSLIFPAELAENKILLANNRNDYY